MDDGCAELMSVTQETEFVSTGNLSLYCRTRSTLVKVKVRERSPGTCPWPGAP